MSDPGSLMLLNSFFKSSYYHKNIFWVLRKLFVVVQMWFGVVCRWFGVVWGGLGCFHGPCFH